MSRLKSKELMNDDLEQLNFTDMIEKMLHGFALHKVVVDDKGQPEDYIYLEVNKKFEDFTGLKKESIIGKKVTEAIPGIDKDKANWIKEFGEVAITGKEKVIENYSEVFNQWFKVSVFSPGKGYFIAVFDDITESKIQEIESNKALREFAALNEEYLAQNEEMHTLLDEVNEQRELVLQKEEMLRAVLNSATEGILVINRQREVLFRNDEFDKIWQISKKVLDTLDDKALLENVVEKVVNGKEFINKVEKLTESDRIEYDEVYLKDGRILERVTYPYSHNGLVYGRVWSFRDVTENYINQSKLEYLNKILLSIRAINKIQASESEPEKIIERSCDSIYENVAGDSVWSILLDDDQNVKYFTSNGLGDKNSAFLKSKKNLKEFDCFTRLNDHDVLVINPEKECRGCPLNELYNDSNLIITRIHLQGKTFGFLVVYLPQKLSGHIESNSLFKELSDDIAFSLAKIELEELRNEYIQKVEDNEAHLESIIRSVPVGIGIVSNRVISDVNSMVCEMLGYNKEDLIGKDARILYQNEKEYNRVGEVKYEQIAQKGTGSTETKWVTKDGKIIDILLSSTPIDQNDWKKGVTFSALDITEKNKAIEENSLLNKAVENYLNEFYLVDAATLKFEKVNKAAIINWQYNEEEIDNLNLTDIICNYSKNELRRLIDAFKGNKDNMLSMRAMQKRKNGSTYPVEIHMSLIRFKRKNYLIAIVIDISERLAAEEKLRKSEERFRQFFTTSPDAITINEMQSGIYYDVNEVFTDLFGYEVIELKGKSVFEKNIWYDETDRLKFVKLLSDKKSILNYESRFLDKSGSVFDGLLSANIIEIEGNPHVISIIRDISDLKQTQSSLRESEEKYRKLVENQGEGVTIVNLDYSIVFANDAAGKLLEIDKGKLIGKNMIDFIDSGELLKLKDKIENESHEKVTYDLRINTSSGKTREIMVTATPLFDDGGKMYARLNIYRDITERKHHEMALKVKNEELISAEEELKAANDELHLVNIELEKYNKELQKAKAKAEESDRLKSSFLANMSHEIRTPMNGMLGFAELLKNKNLTTDKKTKYIDIIHSSGNQLLKIIDDIIDISKIEANQLSIHPNKIDLEPIFDELYLLFESRIKNNPMKKELNLELEKKVPKRKSFIYGDEVRIKQVISNLLNNAMKFTKRGAITFGYEYSGDNSIVCYVKDTGIGIPEEKSKLIFERFRQADETTSREYGGTGIGLTISKSLVDLMGGKIWVESSKNKGSEFYVEFPVSVKDTEQIDSNTDKVPKVSKKYLKEKNILIVEDDDNSYEYLQTLLEDEDCITYRSKTGENIENILEYKDIDLVLMDVQLPGENGLNITRKLRRKGIQIPIIVQTAHAMSEDRDKAFEAGCNEYVSKPIDAERLKELLVKVIT